MLVVCSVTLALAYVQKDPAFLLRLHPSSFVGLASYSDIVGLYHPRLIDQGVFPYVHGYLHNGQPAGGAIEYPVLTGLFMWLAGTLTSGASEYFRFYGLRLQLGCLFPLFDLRKMEFMDQPQCPPHIIAGKNRIPFRQFIPFFVQLR